MLSLFAHRSCRTALVSLTLFTFLVVSTTGCFNTYVVPQVEFRKLQTADQAPRTVTDVEGVELLVESETNLFARSVGGKRYPVTAYNFKMTQSQLVASDRDTLLAIPEIDSFEVDLFNTGMTVLWISLGVAAVGGIIAATVVTAGDKNLYSSD